MQIQGRRSSGTPSPRRSAMAFKASASSFGSGVVRTSIDGRRGSAAPPGQGCGRIGRAPCAARRRIEARAARPGRRPGQCARGPDETGQGGSGMRGAASHELPGRRARPVAPGSSRLRRGVGRAGGGRCGFRLRPGRVRTKERHGARRGSRRLCRSLAHSRNGRPRHGAFDGRTGGGPLRPSLGGGRAAGCRGLQGACRCHRRGRSGAFPRGADGENGEGRCASGAFEGVVGCEAPLRRNHPLRFASPAWRCRCGPSWKGPTAIPFRIELDATRSVPTPTVRGAQDFQRAQGVRPPERARGFRRRVLRHGSQAAVSVRQDQSRQGVRPGGRARGEAAVVEATLDPARGLRMALTSEASRRKHGSAASGSAAAHPGQSLCSISF